MLKYVIALVIAGAMSVPLAAQTAPQANEPARAQPTQPSQPAQPQMVRKCRRVPDYPASGTMLGPTHEECRMVPAKNNGSANAKQGGEAGDAGNR